MNVKIEAKSNVKRTINSFSVMESPFSYKNLLQEATPAYSKDECGLKCIIQNQHPVMICWFVASFIVLCAMFMYTSTLI